MIGTNAKLCRAVFAAAFAASITPVACAQLATLGKGHQLLVDSGLQIWGCDTGASSFTYGNLTNANMNAVIWSHGQSNPGLLTTGQKWGKWVDYTGSPATALNSTENAHYADLIAIQVGDEQQSDLENPNGLTKAWFDAAHAGNYFTDKLLYVNSTFVGDVNAYINFVASANPDAIAWDAYPFGTTGVYPYNWLGKAQIFRRVALGSHIGAHSAPARPYGLYLQSYQGGDGARHPGDLEMRWQQFTAWTLGYTLVDAFTVGGGTSLFNGGSMSSPNEPRYSQFKESARQSKNLGPALVKLISYGYGPNIVLGKDPAGNANAVPIDWLLFNKTNAPPNQQYLTSVAAQNLGTKNGGHPGDVYVGFFNPLHASFGDPAGTTYFMVTNALGAYLQDPTLLAADCTQRITLDFDFGASAINSLQRLRRSDGTVEVVPLSFLTDNKYRLIFDLEGGTGDLFKYNDGTPFVGVPFTPSDVYWDNDGVAANNSLVTGAGLGGGGAWDASASKWYNGSTDGPWAAGNDAVFWGAAGTVTLATPQAASSLKFKTTGYALAGSTLTLTGPSVTVDAGVTATINSVVTGAAGLVKSGAGTLNLAVSNSYSGGTTLNEGVLGIISGALGANPASPVVNVTINNGATLRFNQNNLTLATQRQVSLGPGGGVIDAAGSDGIAGVISGSTLTKTGAGALTLSAANTHSATVIKGGAIVVTSDANLGAIPSSFTAANLTLDGGALRFNADFDISDNRGIAVGAGGGTIDTQSFSNPAGYAQANGIQGSGNLTKIGSGVFFMNTPAGQLNNNWTGNLILKEGTWKISERGGLPFNPPTSGPVYAGQITFDGGTLQIAAAIPNVTNGRRGITVAAGGGTIDTQGFTFNWAGPLAGDVATAVLTKNGAGTLQFNANAVPAPATYAGILNVNQGKLVINGGGAMGPQAAIQLAAAAGDGSGVALAISGSAVTIGSLAGGGAAGGNVSLAASLIVGGNNNSTSFNGRITGSGGLTKTGSGTFTLAPLSDGNAYSGGTAVNGGTLLVNNPTVNGVGGDVTVNAGGTLGGGGMIPGNVLNSGALAPGNSAGTIHIGGSYTQASSGMLMIEIGGVASGAYDLAEIAGSAILDGQLQLALVGGFIPSPASTFTILTAPSVSGTFANAANGQRLATVDGISSFIVHYGPGSSYNPHQVVLSGFQPGADFNENQHVDDADFGKWRLGFGASAGGTHMDGDADGDQDVDGFDFLAWQRQFGASSSQAATSTVPEPATFPLLALGALALSVPRRVTMSQHSQR